MSIVRCTHCGTTNRAGSNFCNRCGAELGNQEQSGASAPLDPDRDPKRGTPSPTQESPEHAAPTPDRPESRRPAGGFSGQASDRNPSTTDPDADLLRDGGDEDDLRRPTSESRQPQRMVTGIQGLLDPIRISTLAGVEELSDQNLPLLPQFAVPANQLRRIRDRIAEDPTLVEHSGGHPVRPQVRFRLPWIFTLLALAISVPLLFRITVPVGAPQQWPGVAEAYTTIENLPSNSSVWLYWAYDPATAGELDLLAQPLVKHLMERNAQVRLVTLLPAGLATARRLWGRAAAELQTERNLALGFFPGLWSETYLPGGAPALALLAAAPELAQVGVGIRNTDLTASMGAQRPALAVVVAAQTEDVQQWLELVQPELYLPTVAFTSAGADPLLRPYLATGQLQGLVSGFDGAAVYQQLRNQSRALGQASGMTQQFIAQNWGHIALILILVLGNLRALWLGTSERAVRRG
ncbi:MAG: zinc ribbon domain-containing protein [Caldilineaceae bacterium]